MDCSRRQDRGRAAAFVEQAFDFFEAAANPQIGSKPVLYYYSFLNLAKSALLIRQVPIPTELKHGISDPRANARTRLRLSGQRVRIPGAAASRSELFPEFVKILGGAADEPRDVPVLRLFGQVASIHRTHTRVAGEQPSFIPVRRCELLRERNDLWVRLVFDKHDKDVQPYLSHVKRRPYFRRVLKQKLSGNDTEIVFETEPIVGQRRGIDPAVKRLSEKLRSLHLATILTTAGYRYYLSTVTARYWLPPLAAGYAALFYLGSVTRYKPDVFDKILSGGYSWVVGELLATYPLQFVYGLASELAGVDVVRPYAAVR
jgi:hypothetical protein